MYLADDLSFRAPAIEALKQARVFGALAHQHCRLFEQAKTARGLQPAPTKPSGPDALFTIGSGTASGAVQVRCPVLDRAAATAPANRSAAARWRPFPPSQSMLLKSARPLLMQTFNCRGVAWYAVSAVAESSRGFGTLTTLCDSSAACEVPHLLIETLPMGPEALLLYICLQASRLLCCRHWNAATAVASAAAPAACQQTYPLLVSSCPY